MWNRGAFLTLLISNCTLPAGTSNSAPMLRVAIGETKPPYIFSQEERGVEMELLASLLQEAGYQTQMVYVPSKRAQMLLSIGAVDAAIGQRGDYLSQPYIAYQNVAVTLCSAHIVLKSVADLTGRRIGAFQNAHLFLGPGFADIAIGNPNYRETPQASINRMLFARRIDVGISDINIFKSINDQLGMEAPTAEPWCVHALFPPTQYRLAFRDRGVRDRFDAALKRALRRGRYESLAKRYRLPLVNGHPYFKPTSHYHGRR